ncbi:MAG: hypothetical protein H6834_05630 [Planctomycetes bacterium]|nr:hypothetical protein [Planctomycetota bacterium]
MLTTFGAFNGRFRHLWIGLNDVANEGTFVWSSGEPLGFTRWGAGEPNGSTSENYVHIAAWPWIGGFWNDSHGSSPSAFGANVDPQAYGVVEVANPDVYYSQFNSATGHYYHRLAGGWTWTDAEAAAQRLGGHLVTLNDQAEHDFLHTELSAGPGELLWIGFSDAAQEGQWAWVTGEPANYFAWAPGEPSGGTNRNYAVSETVAPRGILLPGPWWAVPNNFAALTAIVEIEPTTEGQGWGCRDRDGVPLRLNYIGQARPGGTVDIQLIDSVGLTGAALLYLGASNRSWSGLDLPLDFGAFGLAGCTVYAPPEVRFSTLPLSGTRATLPAPTPNDPIFIGVSLYFQAWGLDPRITNRGALLTSDYLWVHYSP